MKTFQVHTQRFGVLRVLRETKAEVVAWAAEALPEEVVRIVKDEIKVCAGCESAPCCCGGGR